MILETIDKLFKGAKTYLTSGIGFVLVAYMQTQGVDLAGTVDHIEFAVKDTVTQIAGIWAILVSTFRKAMPDKRGDS